MNRILFATATGAAAASAALGMSPVAMSQPDDGSNSGTAGEPNDSAGAPRSAATKIEELRSEGRNVIVTGKQNAPLEACDIASIKNDEPTNTAFVDVICTPGYLD